jgi:PAS domain S-box-containing protein
VIFKEPRHSEHAAEFSPSAWSAVFQAIGQPVFILNTERVILAANQAALDRAGAGAVGKKCYEVFHEHGQSEHKDACPVQQLLTTKRPQSAVMRLAGLEGVYVVSCAPLLGKDGSVENIVHVATDITERIAAEEAIARSEERYRTLFETAPLGILVSDAQTRILQANPQAAAILGTTAEKLLGRLGRELLHPDDAAALSIETAIQRARAGEAFTLERRYRRDDGEYAPVEVNLKILDDQGSHLVFFQDISRRKQAEAELQESMSRVELASRAKSAFLANMSHEVRTPLNGMMGMLQLVRATLTDPEPKRFLDLGLESGKRLLTILNDILDLSRVESGRIGLLFEPFSPVELLEEVLAIFRSQAEAKGLRLSMDVSAQVPFLVRGDPGKIRQTLFNLVGNAVKFTPKGEVRIELSSFPLPNDRDHFKLLFSVADSGPGIRDEEVLQLFEPFVQAAENRGASSGSAGLGLAIVKRLVSLMHGDISVESEHGSGATFYFTAKVGHCPERALRKPEEKPAADPNGGARHIPLRVLLVEDDVINRLGVQFMLQREGHEVTCAGSGVQALELLEAAESAGLGFDLALMDIQMPGMDGLEATRRIRSSSASYAGVPIVAITAYAMKGDRERFLDAGMSDYLAKPFDMKDLLKTLARVLPKARRAP